MFTQLSLFDSILASDTAASTVGFVHVSPTTGRRSAESKPSADSCPLPQGGRISSGRESSGRTVADQRRTDAIRPMGELAQLVLARYDLLASRRQERERRRREQPRKSIRVLA